MSIELQSVQEFKDLIEQTIVNKTILVTKLYFDWCPHCQKIREPFEALARRYLSQKVQFLSIDMDQWPEVAQVMDVNAGPTFIILRGNTIIQRVEGANLQKVEQALSQIPIVHRSF